MYRIACLPNLDSYPELAVLELQNNCVASIAEQRCLSALASLNLSFNQLRNASELENLRLLVSLTELQLNNNAIGQDPRQVLLQFCRCHCTVCTRSKEHDMPTVNNHKCYSQI